MPPPMTTTPSSKPYCESSDEHSHSLRSHARQPRSWESLDGAVDVDPDITGIRAVTRRGYAVEGRDYLRRSVRFPAELLGSQ